MNRERLYVVHGTGADTTGLVGAVTTALAAAGGNIVDLRQDVLHGLFTLHLVVDLNATPMRLDELRGLVGRIQEDTGLELAVGPYHPLAHPGRKKAMLVVLVGADRPGIIASVCETLARYRVNIDLAWNIGREGVFVMELMTDVGLCTIPLSNLQSTLTAAMATMGIQAAFQTEDVYNKKKGSIVFDCEVPLIGTDQVDDIVLQTGMAVRDACSLVGGRGRDEQLVSCARILEGVPLGVVDALAQSLRPGIATAELLVTLRHAGYRVAVVARVFGQVTSALVCSGAVDYARGVEVGIDSDTRTLNGTISSAETVDVDATRLADDLAAHEGIDRAEVTIIPAANAGTGIRLVADLDILLTYHNDKVLSRETLAALLCGLGLYPDAAHPRGGESECR